MDYWIDFNLLSIMFFCALNLVQQNAYIILNIKELVTLQVSNACIEMTKHKLHENASFEPPQAGHGI